MLLGVMLRLMLLVMMFVSAIARCGGTARTHADCGGGGDARTICIGEGAVLAV